MIVLLRNSWDLLVTRRRRHAEWSGERAGLATASHLEEIGYLIWPGQGLTYDE